MPNTIQKRKNKIIQDKIIEGIKRFNEIRVPEAKVELREFKNKQFLINFSGFMCFTCGTYDYFEDFIFELENQGLKTKIRDFQNFGDYFLVQYKITN